MTITFSSEPSVITRYVPGEQVPGLPGGLRFPALIGESQTYILRENIAIVKGGVVNFGYNALTGILSTEEAIGPEDIIRVQAVRANGLDFELIFTGNSSTAYDLSDISLATVDITEIRVGGQAVTASPSPVNHPVNIAVSGPSVPVLTITQGDTVTWTNIDTISHGVQNDSTSAEEFSSGPAHMIPTASFSHTFETTGTFTYFDPLLPQDPTFTGTVVVEPLLGYTYDEPNRELTFSFEVPVAKNIIEIDTEFSTPSDPVTIRIDGDGTVGPYDIDLNFALIQQILSVQLTDIADPLPDSGVTEILRVGDSALSTDYTSLDYLLVNDTIEWGPAVTKAAGDIALSSVQSFEDKVFVEVGDKPDVLDDIWVLEVTVVGTTGVGAYTITRQSTGGLIGTFLTSPGIVPTSPIPGINLIVTETLGTTVGDTVLVTTHAGTAKEPSAGDTYFVTYRVRKTDFSPKIFFRFADVKREYGDVVREFNPNGSPASINSLVLAAFLAFINGAAGIVLVQTDFGLSGVSTATDYIDAIDRVREVDDIGVIVPLTSDSIVRDYAKSHVNIVSGPDFKRERGAFVSAPPQSTLEELIGIARGLADRRVVLVTPTAATTEVQDEFGNPVVLLVEGFFLAAALAGLDASTRFDVAEPLTRKRIIGFRTLENEFTKPEKDRLSANGALVIQTIGTSFSVRQSITTSVRSIEEREWSITKVIDFTAQACRAACDRFIGTKLVEETPIWVEASLANILQSLQNDQIISAFAGVEARVDPSRPDTIQATFAFRPLYPTNFVVITFSINSRL